MPLLFRLILFSVPKGHQISNEHLDVAQVETGNDFGGMDPNQGRSRFYRPWLASLMLLGFCTVAGDRGGRTWRIDIYLEYIIYLSIY